MLRFLPIKNAAVVVVCDVVIHDDVGDDLVDAVFVVIHPNDGYVER